MIESKVNIIKDYFKDLVFYEQGHRYEAMGYPLSSVSKSISKYGKEFDSQTISKFVADSRGISQEEVLKEWSDINKEACDLGDQTHLFAESYFADKSLIPQTKHQEAVVNFWNTIPDYIIPVFSELQMYSEILGIAGTADLIFYNTKTGNFIIMDYKSNKDIFKNYKGQTLLPPFEDLLDNPFNKYQLQLSFYKYLFEQTGFKVERQTVIWLLPNGTFRTFNTIDYINRIL